MMDLSEADSLQEKVTLAKIRKDLDKVATEAKSVGKDASKAVMD